MPIGNRQEAFDHVVRHLFKQGMRAEVDGGCLYRGPNGTKCAVGCLIPDEIYNRKLEGRSIFNLPDKILDQLPDPYLLDELQQVHDNSNSWLDRRHLYDRLSRVATRFDLNTKALKKAYNNAHW